MAEFLVVNSEEPSTQINSNTECISTRELQIVQKAVGRPEWLPDGWTMDVKTRRSGSHMGSGYKCYVDPLKGYKFYSKPEVLRYLEIIKDNGCIPKKPKRENRCTPKKEKYVNSCAPKGEKKENICTPIEERKENSCIPIEEKREDNCTPKEEKRDNNCTLKEEEKCPNIESPRNVVIEKSAAKGLPSGWIKELRIKTNAHGRIRKDPFYKEPVSGYVFRSKKEVQRYLESGHKPRRKQIKDGNKLSPLCAAKSQKLDQSAPKPEPFASKEIFDKSGLYLSDDDSSRKGQDVITQPEMMVASVPTGESVVKMHSLDGAENLPEMKKISDPDDMPDKEHVGNMMQNAYEKNHSTPSKSKKNEFYVQHRFSPRLAGIEPVQLANKKTNEQNPQVPKRNVRKKRTLDADLENKSSYHVNSVPETEHAHEMQEGVISTSSNLFEDQIVAKEKPNKLETDKIDDKKPEMHTNSNRSNYKRDHHIPRRSSKRFAGFDHGLMNNSISYKKIPEYERKMHIDEINAELQRSKDGAAIELANNAPINGESENRRHESSKIPPISDGQREDLQGEEIVDKKSEPQISFAFHYSWPDPSLEYANNTLTSVLSVEDSVDTGPTKVPQTNIENKFYNFTGRSRDRNDPQVRSNKSKKKKGLKVPLRVSKRLAGLEPDVQPSERAVEYSNKKTCKEQLTATTTATESLTNGAPDHLDAEEETKLTYHASHILRTGVPGESSNKSDKSYDARTVPTEQLQKVDVENIGDERSVPQLPEPYQESWSDPCLEFAFKTLTGDFPFDAATDIFTVMTPDVNDLPNKEFHECLVTSISEEANINSNQSQNKNEPNIVGHPSKPLSRQPELRTDYTSCDNSLNFITRNSCGDEAFFTRNLDGEAICMDVGNVTQLVHHSRDMNTVIHKEPLKENRQVHDGESVITEQQHLETETMNLDNSESLFCDSLMNSWSDPCLEFAYKTLTGVIPLDENLAFQGCFQQPADYHNQNDGGSMLPDFGPPGFSQNDFPFHYDVGVNSIPGQQSSMSSPFLHMEKASLQCPEIHPQKQYSQCNKNFQR